MQQELLIYSVADILVGDIYNFLVDTAQYGMSLIYLLTVVGLFLLRGRSSAVLGTSQIPRSRSLDSPCGNARGEANQRVQYHAPTSMAVFFILTQVFIIGTPFIPPSNGIGDTSLPFWLSPTIGLLLFAAGGIFWFMRWVLWPRLTSSEWIKHRSTLRDGTRVTSWQLCTL